MKFPEPTAEELETFREGETSRALIAFARRTKVEREGGLKFWTHLRQHFERTVFPKWHVDAQAALDVFHGPRIETVVGADGAKFTIVDVRGTEFEHNAMLARDLVDTFLHTPSLPIPMPYGGKL